MSDKKTIKVVKRVERDAAQRAKSKDKSAQKSARDMVATVAGWVDDFQQNRRHETSGAIRNLVQARRQPAES